MRRSEEAICHILSGPDFQKLLSEHGGRGEIPRDTMGAATATCPRFPPHRLNLHKSRLLTRAAKGFLSKPLTKAPEPTPGSQNSDYIPLVSGPRPQTSAPHTPRGAFL